MAGRETRDAGGGGSLLRKLAWFWGPVAVVLVAGAAVLQVLGPPARLTPRPAPVAAGPAKPIAAAPIAAAAPAPQKLPAAGLAQGAAARLAPGAPVPGPDPALLEPSDSYPGMMLPRIGPDGRTPMQAYAAGYDATDKRPRIALLVAGVGMSEVDSEELVRSTPAAVSLAISPYAASPERLLEAARARGHETLIAIPMEPQNYPLNDAGSYALLTAAPPAANALRLEWALSRITGYVGATGALGRLRGERFAAAADQMAPVLGELAGRGLLYVDPRPGGSLPHGGEKLPPSRAVDLVVDEPPVRSEIDARLAQLEQVARDRGSALGLVGDPAPVTTERIAAWAATLGQRGFLLAPVSAVVLMAPPQPATAAK